jgi:hypothetical protein
MWKIPRQTLPRLPPPLEKGALINAIRNPNFFFYTKDGNIMLISVAIIDMHSHIGNILYPSGGGIIFQTGKKFPPSTGLQLLDEKYLFRDIRLGLALNRIFPNWSTDCERKRNNAATLQNFQKSFEYNHKRLCKAGLETEIKLCVCLPVAPNTDYRDTQKAAQKDSRVIAFASPDFSLCKNNIKLMTAKLASDLSDGAAGIKIHPIIQETPADSKEAMEAVQVISGQKQPKPVLLHSGRAGYYTPKENKSRFADNASAEKTGRLVYEFPNVNFIIGHSGLNEIDLFVKLLKQYKNVWFETSFQPTENIKRLIYEFGADKVLFGSDWPYGLREPAILSAAKACGDGRDKSMLEAIFYGNAANLLNINIK